MLLTEPLYAILLILKWIFVFNSIYFLLCLFIKFALRFEDSKSVFLPITYSSCKQAKILIIVPLCDEHEHVIMRFIAHIKIHTFDAEFYEIVFIENSKSAKCKKVAINIFKQYKFKYLSIKNFKNKAKSVNTYLRNNKYVNDFDYLLFFDIDQLPLYFDISKPISFLKNNHDVIAIQFKESFEFKNIFEYMYNCMQSVFFDIVLLGKSRMGTAMLLGGNFVIKQKEFKETGYFYEDSILEDYMTSLSLNIKGNKIKYFPEFFCLSLPPASISAFLSQQRRYVVGSLDVLVGISKNILNHRLSFFEKLSFLQAGTIYLSSLFAVLNIYFQIEFSSWLYAIPCFILLLLIASGFRYLLGAFLFILTIPFKFIFTLSFFINREDFVVTKKGVDYA